MITFLAFLPIVVVIFLMVFYRLNGQIAGSIGWVLSIAIAFSVFGLNFSGILISQLKGIYLSIFVLAIVWPALTLYQLINQLGSVKALATWISLSMRSDGLLQVGLAWAFSGMIEGIAGFGLPVAIVSPILVGIGVSPVVAVAATAVGHSWSVTFGDMGVIFETLIAITRFDPKLVLPPAGLMLGISCLLCGWGAMFLLKQSKYWWQISLVAILMASTQYLFAWIGLIPLSAFSAGLVSILCLYILSRKNPIKPQIPDELKAAAASYFCLAVLMILVTSFQPVNTFLKSFQLQFSFPSVTTAQNYLTPAVTQKLNIFLHPGSILTLVCMGSFFIYIRTGLLRKNELIQVAKRTWQSAAPTSLGVLSMVGLASVMDHSGMMLKLAQAVSTISGQAFPLISPLIGVLGAFATGSNNNSNVIFAQLQLNSANLLDLYPAVILAAQTTGGALGSMLAPAKIMVGCSTVGLKDGQGLILRQTLGFGIGIALIIGMITLVLAS